MASRRKLGLRPDRQGKGARLALAAQGDEDPRRGREGQGLKAHPRRADGLGHADRNARRRRRLDEDGRRRRGFGLGFGRRRRLDRDGRRRGLRGERGRAEAGLRQRRRRKLGERRTGPRRRREIQSVQGAERRLRGGGPCGAARVEAQSLANPVRRAAPAEQAGAAEQMQRVLLRPASGSGARRGQIDPRIESEALRRGGLRGLLQQAARGLMRQALRRGGTGGA